MAAAVTALRDAWSLVLPVECSGCGSPGRGLCERCRIALTPAPVCGALPDGTPVVSALRYDGRVREVMLAFKEQGRTDASAALAAALHAAVLHAIAPRDTAPHAAVAASDPQHAQLTAVLHDSVTTPALDLQHAELAPVPTSRSAFRRRGYDPVMLVVRRAGGRPARVLRSTGIAAGVQKRLDRDARAQNRAGTMRASSAVAGRSFVLVDDVLTTGATLVEAARALRDGGARVVAAVTIAWTPRRSHGGSGDVS